MVTISIWKFIAVIVLASPVINLVWYWAFKSILRAPADIRGYFAKIKQS